MNDKQNCDVIRYLVINGNIVNGLSFFGPFTTQEEAWKWAEDEKFDWVVTEMRGPL